MKISKLSNVYCNTPNYSTNKLASKQNCSVSFQKTPLKNAAVGAALALATFVGASTVNAQTLQNNTENTEVQMPMPEIISQMAKYYRENGFTKEQRQEIADYTEEYASKHFKTLQKCYENNYRNCSYYGPIRDDFPANPFRLNLNYHMGKAEKYAKDLTEFRKYMILNGVVRNGHYIPNPELDPYADTQEEINKILGDGVTFKDYLKNNAELVAKLDDKNFGLNELINLTDEERTVLNNIVKCISIGANYINKKGTEYKAEADSCMEKILNDYDNDMNNLDIFRDEENDTINTFIDEKLKLNYWASKEGFSQALLKVYGDIIKQKNAEKESFNTEPYNINSDKHIQATTGIESPKAKADKQTLVYDLSGKVVSAESLKPGIYIKDGKKFAVK